MKAHFLSAFSSNDLSLLNSSVDSFIFLQVQRTLVGLLSNWGIIILNDSQLGLGEGNTFQSSIRFFTSLLSNPLKGEFTLCIFPLKEGSS